MYCDSVSFPRKALAVGREAAALTLRPARDAYGSSVQHQPVTEVRRFLRRQNRAQLRLHLCRVLSLGKAQKVCDADAVRIADDGAGNLINIAKQKICRLAPYAGKGQKFFHCAGHLAAELFAQRLTGEDNVARLMLIKPA